LWLTTKERNPRANYIFNYFRIQCLFLAYARSNAFKAQDGITVNARLYKPEQNTPIKRQLFCAWMSFYKMHIIIEYTENTCFIISDAGYTVLDIDYRGVMVTDEICEQVYIVLWRKRFVRSNLMAKVLNR
jgi:hypothetical protein